MSSTARSWMGPALGLVGILGITGTAVIGLVRDERPSIDSSAIDSAAAEIRVRALADSSTLGVSGLGCDDLLRGSGFVVGEFSYTNRHLVEGGESVKFDQLIEPIVVPVASMGSGLDVAVAPAVDAISLDFAQTNAAVGETVFVSGHAGGGETEVVRGTVHLYSEGDTWGVGGNAMLIDVVTEPGFSGGPVLDLEGKVVGMLQGYEPTLELTLAIPVEDLRSWSALGQDATTDRCRR